MITKLELISGIKIRPKLFLGVFIAANAADTA